MWLEEAEHLRGPAAECWGGAVAISAYSLLRQRRVFVHVKVAGPDVVEVQDSSHVVVDADAPVAHLLYNGVDHYKALIEAELSDAMPAWPQPPPPRYFAPAVAEAAGAAAAAVYAEARVRLRRGQGVDFAARSFQVWPPPRPPASRPAQAADLAARRGGPPRPLRRCPGAASGKRPAPSRSPPPRRSAPGRSPSTCRSPS